MGSVPVYVEPGDYIVGRETMLILGRGDISRGFRFLEDELKRMAKERSAPVDPVVAAAQSRRVEMDGARGGKVVEIPAP